MIGGVPPLLGLLHELVPKGSVIGLLVNPSNPNAELDTKDAESAAQELGHGLIVRARIPSEHPQSIDAHQPNPQGRASCRPP